LAKDADQRFVGSIVFFEAPANVMCFHPQGEMPARARSPALKKPIDPRDLQQKSRPVFKFYRSTKFYFHSEHGTDRTTAEKFVASIMKLLCHHRHSDRDC